MKAVIELHKAMLVAVMWVSCLAAAPRLALSQVDELTGLGQLSRSFEAMIEAVSPSVVKVFVSGFVPRSGIVSSTGDLLARQHSTGSGVIVDADGYIVTNAHVVSGARRVQVLIATSGAQRADRSSILKPSGDLVGAQIVGVDNETDLAVLKVAKRGLSALQLSDSDAVRKGQLVFAFGSPLGLENSVSMGVVSSVARQLRQEDPMIYIQTDATINPGNSGGPLVNASGEVVGINTFILSQSGGSEGIGFAAPSNIVRNVFEQIRQKGAVQRGAIGVFAQTITPTLAAAMGLQQDWGVILGDVYPNGPGAQAGLQIGDVILSLDGKLMENGRQLEVNLYSRRIGTRVTLEVLRNRRKRRVEVTVIERPGNSTQFLALVNRETNLVENLGILAMDLTPQVERLLPPLRRKDGVLVAGRAVDAPFWESGLLPGDVIYSLNGESVESLEELRKHLSKLKVYDAVVMQVERSGRLMFVSFELE
ncbi:MAG: trypsin-like peptidase domain-containing protein [Candidatus Latescibacterota bacterium]|nr:MAG: trypsin-like peptidase domain-containing protein [Candidatus Latescibacterota bacterium]